MFILIVVAAVVAVALYGLANWVGATERSEDAAPDGFIRPVWVEVPQVLRSKGKFAVVGRIDSVYREPDGTYFPMELWARARHQVHETDIAQLSLQSWLLRESGMPTAAYGCVATRTPDGQVAFMPVTLYSQARCEQIIARHIELVKGGAPPRLCGSAKKCARCEYAALCAAQQVA